MAGRVPLRNTRLLASTIERAVTRSPKFSRVAKSRMQEVVGTKVEKVAGKHYNGAIRTIANTLSEGVGSRSTVTSGLSRLQVRSVASGRNIRVSLSPSFRPLAPTYQRFKRRMNVIGMDKFWLKTGKLSARVQAIAAKDRKAEAVITRSKENTVGKAIQFDIIVLLQKLPPPLDDLIRRSMIAEVAQTAGPVAGELRKLLFLELGTAKSPNTKRPFVGQLSARLGRDMRTDLKKL